MDHDQLDEMVAYCPKGAYGIMAEVESHPFDLDTMLFMDWRDDFTSGDDDMAVWCLVECKSAQRR